MEPIDQIKFRRDNYFGYRLASPTQRLIAVVLESVIILIINWALLWTFDVDSSDMLLFNDNSIADIAIRIGISAFLGALYYTLWSGNLGHKIMGLKVISSKDGSDQNSAKMGTLREGLKSLLGLFVIPSLWLLWDRDNRNLYDLITNTLVVEKN